MDNQQERLFNIGWFIAALESEGGFCFVRSAKNNKNGRYTPLITISNTDYYFMNMVVKVLKQFNIPYYIYARKKPRSKWSKKKSWEMIIRGYKRCDDLLKFILPFLRTDKIKQAILMKEVVDYRLKVGYRHPYGEYEDGIYHKMKELNKIPRDYTLDTITGEDIVRSHIKV